MSAPESREEQHSPPAPAEYESVASNENGEDGSMAGQGDLATSHMHGLTMLHESAHLRLLATL